MAILVAHRGKLWVAEGGVEYTLVLIAAFTVLIFTGPGRFSLNAAFGLSVPLSLTLLVAGTALLTVFLALGTRKVQVPAQTSQPRKPLSGV